MPLKTTNDTNEIKSPTRQNHQSGAGKLTGSSRGTGKIFKLVISSKSVLINRKFLQICFSLPPKEMTGSVVLRLQI
jgi:hypothetical protein